MEIVNKRIDKNLHLKFVNTVKRILNEVGLTCSIEHCEKSINENSYYLCIPNTKQMGKWHLGIWAVGDWGIESEYTDDDGEVHEYRDGYGVDLYEPNTISVFLIHDWNYDKFRPTYSDYEIEIKNFDEDHIKEAISTVKHAFENPIDSFCNYANNDSCYNYHYKYFAYIDGWYTNEVLPLCKKISRRLKGWTTTKILNVIASIDPRVHHKEYTFKKDKWNPEFEFAVVLKCLETEYKEYKAWLFYDWFMNKNLRIDITYLDEDGNMPKSIWRGVYWNEIPEKE